MKFTSTVLALISLLNTSLVAAENCKDNYLWCGWDLIKKGDYYDYLKGKLQGLGKCDSDRCVRHSLWRCKNDEYGNADFYDYCQFSDCAYGGSEDSDDHC